MLSQKTRFSPYIVQDSKTVIASSLALANFFIVKFSPYRNLIQNFLGGTFGVPYILKIFRTRSL